MADPIDWSDPAVMAKYRWAEKRRRNRWKLHDAPAKRSVETSERRGLNPKDWIAAHGWTVNAFARELDVNESHLRRIFTHERYCSPEIAQRMAAVIGIPIERLNIRRNWPLPGEWHDCSAFLDDDDEEALEE